MKRRELASVAEGVLGSFVSRNNDVDGWWAMGLLALALPAPDRVLRLDLLTGESEPDLAAEHSGLRNLPATWRAVFADRIERQRVRNRPNAATITLRFTPLDVPGADILIFSCDVEITDASGRQCSARGDGVCRPHDVGVERRSGGPNRLAEKFGLMSPTATT